MGYTENNKVIMAYVGADGYLTLGPSLATNPFTYQFIAHRLSSVLAKSFQQGTTTIHIDGRPSLQ
ncbi:hypothetical protein EDD11_000384 [Mortierella claussenii]|nr:hypothetical protein EDD11_000384 [Mortierella claussenii]